MMQLLALLPSHLLEHLTEVVGEAHSVRSASDPLELHRLLRSVDASLLLVDPMVADGRFADDIERLIIEFSNLPTVVYTTVSARAMGLVLRFAPLGVRHLVLFEHDDEPHQLLELIDRVPAYPVIELMLRELREMLSPLPASVRRAVQQIFISPSGARTGADLAAMAGMTRRSLYRHMLASGLRPRDLIDCARLLRAFVLLRIPGNRLKDTSAKLGFADPDTLRDLIREWTGQTTRSLRRDIEPDTLVRLLAAHLQRTRGEFDTLLEPLGATAE